LDNGECPLAAFFNDGVWYDTGWFHRTALALSTDGIHWTKPNFGVVGDTNLIISLRAGYERDGALVCLEQHAIAKEECWKIFLFHRIKGGDARELYTSLNGINWELRGEAGPCDDNSSFFYDPFRKNWCSV